MWTPQTAEELAEALLRAARHEANILLRGNGSKHRMAGPVERADEEISTAGLGRVLQYEPNDLTISVEAGLRWSEFTRLLAEHRQMVPLDPPFADRATVGGVIAANSSGARRRLYGTARDLVIGMRFATLEGKLVDSGGMVVKNVAGLDMAKLMIGSFGTLAAIVVVNFKLSPMPEMERSFLLPFDTASAAIAARDKVLAGVLQPAALDLWNPGAAATVGNRAWLLAVRAGGNRAVVDRYERELALLGDGVALENAQHEQLWQHIQEFTPRFLERHADGAVVRASCTLKEVEAVMASLEGPALARAASGVCYGYFEQCDRAAEWLGTAVKRGWRAVMEFAPEERKRTLDLWPGLEGAAGPELEVMRRVKALFDPSNLLNRGRLYRRI
ncbi:MAG TPA: FAD-binding oxidoreductase [Bryobacteraceae bacterium]|nr:FAD-binding oxidoreductase [Bryobacteraceae bacterium]